MFDELATSVKRQAAIPNAGDHVIASSFKSKDAAGVQKEIEQFMKQVLHIKPVVE